MVTALGNIALTNDYSEIARRPLEADQCALIVIDIQEKLLPPIFQREQLFGTPSFLSASPEFSRCRPFSRLSTPRAWGTLSPTLPVYSRHPGDRQADVLLLWKRSVLLTPEATSGKSHHRAPLRNGKPYLRDPNRAWRLEGRLPGACRQRCRQLAHRMELENRPGAHASRGSSALFYRNDYL